MKAFHLLREIKQQVVFPMMEKNGKPVPMSNSELRRLLEQKAVQVNDSRPGPDTEIDYPIDQLIFFPSGKKKTTLEDYFFTDPQFANSPNNPNQER